MSAEPQVAEDLDVPAPGSTVSLLSTSRDIVASADLESWSASPSGLAVTAQVTTTPQVAQSLGGERTWISAHTEQTNTLVVFEGIARQTRPGQPGILRLDGVSLIAREHRRAVPRAQVPCDVELHVDQGSPGTARVIDLSRGGCRVRLPEPDLLVVGQTAVAELTLPEDRVVRTSCQVLRLDDRRQEAVLTFGELSDADAAALSRSVLAELSASGGRPDAAGA